MSTTGVNLPQTLSGYPGMYMHREADVLPIQQAQEGEDVSVKLLDQKNIEFSIRYEAWIDLGLLYEGGSSLKNRCERVLKKRPREDEEVFAARMDNFTYQPILGTGLGWYGAAMFDTPPEIFFNKERESDKAYYSKFLENCDGIGTTFVDYFKKVFQVLLTYGAAWNLTDIRAVIGTPAVTLADERSTNALDPHVLCYTPLNVINWQEDELGELKWVVIKTEVQKQEFLSDPEIVSTWYYFDRQEYKVYENIRKPEEQLQVAVDDTGRMAKFLRGGKHALARLNRVPVRRLLLSEGLWLANRAYLLLIDHLNQDNTLKWALFMSNLAMPVIIGDGDYNNEVYSETGYLQFPEGTKYEWSEPAGTSFEQSAKRVESVREECFRSMNLQSQGRSMRATPAMQSGRSKILEMAPAKQILAGMGDDLRKHMQGVLSDVKDIRRNEYIEPDVRGFNFEEEMTTEEVFAVTSVLNLKIPSKKFEKYVQKKTAKTWMIDANRSELEEVYKEIETGPTMEEQADEELKKRVELASKNLGKGLTPKGPPMPPGRGGDGPKPGKQ